MQVLKKLIFEYRIHQDIQSLCVAVHVMILEFIHSLR